MHRMMLISARCTLLLGCTVCQWAVAAIRYEVRLSPRTLGIWRKVVPTQPEVECQAWRYFPIVLSVGSDIVAGITGLRKVRSTVTCQTAEGIDSIRNRRTSRRQEQIRYTQERTVIVDHVTILAGIRKIPASVWWL